MQGNYKQNTCPKQLLNLGQQLQTKYELNRIIYMTDKQMNDLAVRVATKVVKAIFNVSSEVHLVFENHSLMQQDELMVTSKEDLDKQTLNEELVKLKILLDRYVQEENYEKANIIKRKIQLIKIKYDKLD